MLTWSLWNVSAGEVMLVVWMLLFWGVSDQFASCIWPLKAIERKLIFLNPNSKSSDEVFPCYLLATPLWKGTILANYCDFCQPAFRVL